MSNKIVSVIVPTAGTKDYIYSCLSSLGEQSCASLEILVIDNSPGRNIRQKIGDNHPGVRVYSTSRNLSYCESVNKGIEISGGDFILCLNDDTVLEAEFIMQALKGFEVDTRIGMVSGKILRRDGRTIDSAGLFLSIFRSAVERGYGLPDKGQFDKEGYIFGASGAAAFYRREMLEEVKIGPDYFDSGHSFFYEDLDIAWRAQNAGWKGYYIPKAVAYHARGASVRGGRGMGRPYARRYLSDELYFDLLKNRYLAIIKNESIPGLLMHMPFIALYDICAWACVLFSRPLLIKRFFLNLNYLKSAMRKRKITRCYCYPSVKRYSPGNPENKKYLTRPRCCDKK